MRGLPLILVCAASVAVAQPTIEEEASRLAWTTFASINRGLPALVHLTPPIPKVWPPNGRSVIYAYAVLVNSPIDDGDLVLPVFARLDVERGKVTVGEAAQSIGPGKGQGILYLPPNDPALKKAGPATAAILSATQVPRRSAADVRDYYCQWARYHRVAAEQVRSRHTDFFTWLACPK